MKGMEKIKSLDKFLSDPNSFYITILFLFLWCIDPLFENRAAGAICSGVAAVGLSAAVIKDFYDVQRGSFFRQIYKAAPNYRELLPYRLRQIQEDKKLQMIQKIVLITVLANIVSAYLADVISGTVGRIALILALLLPLCAFALYLMFGRFITLTESNSDFVDSGFGRIFGMKRVSLILYFVFSIIFIFNVWALDEGSVTFLSYGKYLLAVAMMSTVIDVMLFVGSVECKKSKPLAAAVVMAGIIYSFLFVWQGNILFDFSKPEIYECQWVAVSGFDPIYGVNIHRDDYLTVKYGDGKELELHMPFDFSADIDEVDTITVAHHKGAFGIEWAEIIYCFF